MAHLSIVTHLEVTVENIEDVEAIDTNWIPGCSQVILFKVYRGGSIVGKNYTSYIPVDKARKFIKELKKPDNNYLNFDIKHKIPDKAHNLPKYKCAICNTHIDTNEAFSAFSQNELYYEKSSLSGNIVLIKWVIHEACSRRFISKIQRALDEAEVVKENI